MQVEPAHVDTRRPEVGVGVAAGAAVAIAVGVVVGVLTSFGQGHLEGSLNPLVNSAAAWLVAPFFVGALARTPAVGGLAGVLCCAAQVASYFVTSELRGFPASSAFVLFWAVCAVVGGPLFGAGGQLWRHGPERLGAPASTLLPAVFLAEGLWVYVIELGYTGSAVLWFAIGAVLAVVLPRRLVWLRWLPLTAALGLAGEIALNQIHTQAF